MVDSFYVYCIDDKDLQEIAKTEMVGFCVCFLLIRCEGNELTQCMALIIAQSLKQRQVKCALMSLTIT